MKCMKKILLLFIVLCSICCVWAQEYPYTGISFDHGRIYKIKVNQLFRDTFIHCIKVDSLDEGNISTFIKSMFVQISDSSFSIIEICLVSNKFTRNNAKNLFCEYASFIDNHGVKYELFRDDALDALKLSEFDALLQNIHVVYCDNTYDFALQH